MKKIFLTASLVIVTGLTLIAGNGTGNGNGTCNCSDKVDMYAAGVATWLTSTQIECTGTTGTCWEITYNGGFILTIYTVPPIVFGNKTGDDNPQTELPVLQRRDNSVIYQVDPNIWQKK
jgi:hypothetical protein